MYRREKNDFPNIQDVAMLCCVPDWLTKTET